MFQDLVKFIISYHKDDNVTTLKMINTLKREIHDDLTNAFEMAEPLLDKYSELYSQSSSFFDFLTLCCEWSPCHRKKTDIYVKCNDKWKEEKIALKEEYEKEIMNLRKKILQYESDFNSEFLNNVKEKYDTNQKQLTSQHEREIKQLVDKYNTDIKQLKHDHEEERRKWINSKDEELKQWKEKFESGIKSDYDLDIKKVKNECEIEKMTLRTEIDRLKMDLWNQSTQLSTRDNQLQIMAQSQGAISNVSGLMEKNNEFEKQILELQEIIQKMITSPQNLEIVSMIKQLMQTSAYFQQQMVNMQQQIELLVKENNSYQEQMQQLNNVNPTLMMSSTQLPLPSSGKPFIEYPEHDKETIDSLKEKIDEMTQISSNSTEMLTLLKEDLQHAETEKQACLNRIQQLEAEISFFKKKDTESIVKELKTQLQQTRDELFKYKDEVIIKTKDLNTCNDQIIDLNTQIEMKNAELEKYRGNELLIRKKITEIERNADETQSELQKENNKLSDEINYCNKEWRECRDKLSRIELEKKQLEHVVKILNGRITGLETDFNACLEENQNFTEKHSKQILKLNEQFKTKSVELQSKETELNTQIKTKSEELEELKRRLLNANNSIKEYEGKVTECTQYIKKLESNLNEKEKNHLQEVNDLKQKLYATGLQLQSLENTNRELELELKTVKTEYEIKNKQIVDECKKQFDSLKLSKDSQISKLEVEIKQLNDKLQNSESSKRQLSEQIENEKIEYTILKMQMDNKSEVNQLNLKIQQLETTLREKEGIFENCEIQTKNYLRQINIQNEEINSLKQQIFNNIEQMNLLSKKHEDE
ncbi:putative leucine-rich repeat-containing protein DDB_G0290503, partial [Uloborus diversus]|uniref:putative leucine-rich repeat-containing protein DDB_G0290503 n=1 Tax=Uloborus diversus TaxID=327109 RepID=UPI0024090EFF